MSDLKQVTIFTGSACIHNPGPGGYAAVLRCGGNRRELAGGARWTTNNRMELLAVIEALRALKFRCAATVYSDARHVGDGVMSGSARRWQLHGWMRNGKRVPNADLWEQLLQECARHVVTLCWVKAHAGDADSERCDQLSAEAAQADDLPADEGYEKRQARAAVCAQPSLFDRAG